MADIHLTRINESYIGVHCEDDAIYYELSDRFTFYVPGYKYMPRYRNGIWDGKIRLMDIRKRRTYYGLMGEIAKFARQYKYSLSFDNDLALQNIDVTFDWLNLPFEPFDYQAEAVVRILNDQKRLIVSPTGSGKSLIIYAAIRHLLRMNKKVLLVVPTVSLVHQMYKDFVSYGWTEADENTHRIFSGVEKKNTDKVVITTWQSIYKLKQPWFKDFDAAFIDEAHLASAESLRGIMEKCVNAKYRVGLTGTLQDAKAPKLTLIGLFGAPHNTTSSSDLMDRGVLSELKINAVCLKHKDEDRKIVSKFDYKTELNTIVESKIRNTFIKNIALDRKYNTLVLFNYVDKHGVKLFDMLNKDNTNKKIFFIHGKTPVEEREYAREYTEKHDNVIILASYGVFSTGINIKNLNTVIFAHPYKSKVKNLQSIGRVLRKSPNGKASVLFDIADDYSWKTKKNTTYRHFIDRIALYEKEGFDYKITNIDI